jgi:hypothetical protein
MSSRSRKAHATPVPPDDDVTTLDAFEPDYGTVCHECGESPCVTGIKAGRVVYESGLCGPCTFGRNSASDPADW